MFGAFGNIDIVQIIPEGRLLSVEAIRDEYGYCSVFKGKIRLG